MYAVLQELKQHNPEDILVGIMWSGPDRADWYAENLPDHTLAPFSSPPAKFVKDGAGAWSIANLNFNTHLANLYYTSPFYNTTAHQIATYEKIFATQAFLENLGIDYFMTTYTDQVLLDSDSANPDISWMHSAINWTNWLPINGMFEWCKANTLHDFNEITHAQALANSNLKAHPSLAHNNDFARYVVLPFLGNVSH